MKRLRLETVLMVFAVVAMTGCHDIQGVASPDVSVTSPVFSTSLPQVTTASTGTGFFYPHGSSYIPSTCGIWLGRDAAHGGCYFDGLYHIGLDLMRSQYLPVYAISKGVVASRSNDGTSWGTGNSALYIRHTLSNGSEFIALYGHITTGLQVGDRVSGGTEIGAVGYYSTGQHIHFGIYPYSNVPPAPTGRMLNENWPSTNNFVDPLNWIANQTPKCENGTAERYRPSGSFPVHPNGSLIQVVGDPTIYVLQNGYRRAITSASRLWELYGPGRGFDFRDVITIEAGELNNYPRGADVVDPLSYNGRNQPDGRLIQQWGGTEISIVTDNGT